MKVITVVGARPQFIKAAVVSRALQRLGSVCEYILHTGQHYENNMSEIFFEEMEIPRPKFNLEIGGISHGAMTGRMLEKVEEVLLNEKPDYVLVYGDTNSTLAGALAASKLHIPVAHVEAGLRSQNMHMPEEINRILTDRLSRFLFTPTIEATNNLKSEGFQNFPSMICQVGDVMYDAALFYSKNPKVNLKRFGSSHALLTMHRASNTDNPEVLSSLIDSINQVAEKIKVICPLHPRTKYKIKQFNLKTNFEIIDPVGYFEMLDLLINSSVVMTDSGGLQKEAYFFQKPCITLRGETEWKELVDFGCNFLTGNNQDNIIKTFEKIQNCTFDFSARPYGNGDAGELIAEILKKGSK